MHDGQVRDHSVVHVLVEQGCAAVAVERDAVRDLDEVELLLLGHDVVDVWLKARVGLEDFGAHSALGGGLDLALLAGGELGWSVSWSGNCRIADTY